MAACYFFLCPVTADSLRIIGSFFMLRNTFLIWVTAAIATLLWNPVFFRTGRFPVMINTVPHLVTISPSDGNKNFRNKFCSWELCDGVKILCWLYSFKNHAECFPSLTIIYPISSAYTIIFYSISSAYREVRYLRTFPQKYDYLLYRQDVL